LLSTYRYCRLLSIPRLDGRDPVKLLLVTFTLFNWDNIPRLDGIDPRRLLPLTSRNVRDVSPPSDEGNDPDRPLLVTLIDTINPPEHITFCQLDVLTPAHILDTFGNPPTHCHVLLRAVFEHIPADAQRSHIILPSDHEAVGDLVTVNTSNATGISLLTDIRPEGLDVGNMGDTDGDGDGRLGDAEGDGDELGPDVGCTLGTDDGMRDGADDIG
jgi:hypothetical protein